MTNGGHRRMQQCSQSEVEYLVSEKLTRRQFVGLSAAAFTSAVLTSHAGAKAVSKPSSLGEFAKYDPLRGAMPLTVQPVLAYSLPQRPLRPRSSWRHWGGFETESDVQKELSQIEAELSQLARKCTFPVEILTTTTVRSAEEVKSLKDSKADVLLVYAAGSWVDVYEALAGLGKWMLIFVRLKSGRYYLWHEIVHPRFLRRHTDQLARVTVGYEDVIVDDMDEIAWRLRALYGLRNTLGRKIVCIGGPGAWSGGAPVVERAKTLWKFDMVVVPIGDLVKLIEEKRKDAKAVEVATAAASEYVRLPNVFPAIPLSLISEAFLLARIFLELMQKSNAQAITVAGCMGSYAGIMPCMTLTLLNDSGYMAYCEGDFVNIPAGVLTHFISGLPTFFCNTCFPSNQTMLLAHCTAPTMMDGKRRERVRLLTHFESDHGAATKVEMRLGQKVSVIIPDFEGKLWVAFHGEIVETPFLPVCRSQIVVRFEADTLQLASRLRGFHATVVYGDHIKLVGYALKKLGIELERLCTC
ncbi:MAG: sugar isomerase [Armatimonadota bacterium]|nr:sugar isomerase [Armatimonadota bacterium]MCX7778089.1 sugar isomerase [Armatimonadota bacterium]MDW8025483.1 sugar isomerase [Armatimonadota bacterium]